MLLRGSPMCHLHAVRRDSKAALFRKQWAAPAARLPGGG